MQFIFSTPVLIRHLFQLKTVFSALVSNTNKIFLSIYLCYPLATWLLLDHLQTSVIVNILYLYPHSNSALLIMRSPEQNTYTYQSVLLLHGYNHPLNTCSSIVIKAEQAQPHFGPTCCRDHRRDPCRSRAFRSRGPTLHKRPC